MNQKMTVQGPMWAGIREACGSGIRSSALRLEAPVLGPKRVVAFVTREKQGERANSAAASRWPRERGACTGRRAVGVIDADERQYECT